MERESLGVECSEDSGIVGEGPLYEPMLENARALVPVWCPLGVDSNQNWWNAPPLTVSRTEDGDYTLFASTFGWEKRGIGHRTKADLKTIRAAAISLLVYCAAEDSRAR